MCESVCECACACEAADAADAADADRGEETDERDAREPDREIGTDRDRGPGGVCPIAIDCV